jgi:hypothetical protein
MTQHERILEMLRDGPVCGTAFLEAYMPTYSQRIGELTRDKGYRIYRVECPHDYHRHQSGIATYALSKHQGGTYDDALEVAALYAKYEGKSEPVYDASQEGDAYLAEQRGEQEPEREPPSDDVEDTFHTAARWPDDEADVGHDSATDRALGEGIR